MKFWDTSALVPLIVDEPGTKAARDLLAEDADVMIWTLTSVELLSSGSWSDTGAMVPPPAFA